MFNIISLIIVIGLCFGLIFDFIVPEYNKILELRQKIKISQKELADYRDLLKKSEEYSLKFKELKKDVEKVNFALPPNKDESLILLSINELVPKSGLILEDINLKKAIAPQEAILGMGAVQKPAPEKIYKTLSVELKLLGSYNSLKSFFKALETSMPIMNISSFEINQKEENIFSFNLNLNTYYLRD